MRLSASASREVWFGLVVVVWGLLVPSAAAAQTYSEADIEYARQGTHRFKEIYWSCLTQETGKMLSTDISAEDLRAYLRGVCAAEKQEFKVPFVDYLAMQHPEMTIQDHFASFDYVVQAAIDSAVSGFVQIRNAN